MHATFALDSFISDSRLESLDFGLLGISPLALRDNILNSLCWGDESCEADEESCGEGVGAEFDVVCFG